ncbi:MAG TPA: replicative DNA helicase [Nannocystis exedens]|nr:replicative DNA helicase [Nannocystis exedens]
MNGSRQLPNNREAEAAVLGGILLRGIHALNDVIDVISAEDFYNPASQAIFRAMSTLAQRQEPIDVITLEAQLRATDTLRLVGGIEALSTLGDRYATSHNIAHHAELVRQAAVLRNLSIAAREIAEDAQNDPEKPYEFIDEAEKKIMAVNEHGRKTSYVSSRELLLTVFKNITERHKRKNPITGVPTLFTDLDRMTSGLQPGDLVILAARPSMGKTAFALNICTNACVPQARHRHLPEEERPVLNPVLFFSLEMSSESLIERILCSEARVDFSKLRSGQFIENDFRDLVNAADRISNAKLYVDDQAAPTILEIRARARRFREDKNIFDGGDEQHGMVVVDYLQLARGGGRYDSREQEISEISRGLKGLAKELKMPVIALSQLNRAVDSRADHRPMLSDLRESGAIEQDADVIMFIYRAERYLSTEASPQEREAVENKAEIIIGKQRNGPVGTVHLTFIKHHTRFENEARGEG